MRRVWSARLTQFRVLAFAVVSALAMLAGISVWRIRSMGDLPDVGDPFDVALARQPVEIPDRDNAYVAYAKARIKRDEAPSEFYDAAWEAREDALLLEHVLPGNARREFQQFRFRATNELERSRRALRLLFANWLAQVDKPAADRAPSASHADVLIYEADRTAPPAARAVAPELLSRAIDENLLARSILRPDKPGWKVDISWEGDGTFARERRRRSVLIVKLAAELYRRERGRPPANAGALLGPISRNCPRWWGATTRCPRD